jgi:hypothetical protein
MLHARKFLLLVFPVAPILLPIGAAGRGSSKPAQTAAQCEFLPAVGMSTNGVR